MAGYVKVGITSGTSSEDVRDRMQQLDSTGVPRAFNCEYAAVVEDYQKVENALLTGFGENRVRSNREFCEGIPPYRLKAVLKLLEIEEVTPGASVNDTPDQTEVTTVEKPARIPRLRFSMAGISLGDDLQWADDPETTCKVAADNLRVECEGVEHPLSRLTAQLKGWKANYAQAGPYWLYKGKTLDEWRDDFLAQEIVNDG